MIQNKSQSKARLSFFLERTISNALEQHKGKVNIGGRNITNLRFAYDIDALAEEEQELEARVESLDLHKNIRWRPVPRRPN